MSTSAGQLLLDAMNRSKLSPTSFLVILTVVNTGSFELTD